MTVLVLDWEWKKKKRKNNRRERKSKEHCQLKDGRISLKVIQVKEIIVVGFCVSLDVALVEEEK